MGRGQGADMSVSGKDPGAQGPLTLPEAGWPSSASAARRPAALRLQTRAMPLDICEALSPTRLQGRTRRTATPTQR